MITLVPFAVAAPLTSRHSPDWTFVSVPLLLTFHFWLSAPVQLAMIAFAPCPVPEVSRQRRESPV